MELPVTEIRLAYPTVPLLKFVELYDTHKDDKEMFLALLEVEEASARERQVEEERKLSIIRSRLVRELHHELDIAVPMGVDREHAQAILMYGFIMPGSERSFIGGKVLPEYLVRENVEHKLKEHYDRRKYDAAMAFLKRMGVVNHERASGEHSDGMSLKSGIDIHVSSLAADILHKALEFAHKKKRMN